MKVGRHFGKVKVIIKKKNAGSTASKADKALRIATKLNKATEHKYITAAENTSALTTTWSNLINLTAIAQGDGASDRDGNKVMLESVKVRYGFKASAGAYLQPCAVRMVIVQDLQQVYNTAITPADVFINSAGTAAWNAHYNFPTKVGRFKVLYDKFFNVSPSSVGYASAGAVASSFDHYTLGEITLRKFKKNIRWGATGLDALQENGIYLLMVKSNSNYTVNPEINVQLKFIDN